jgi:alkanesulfonate monooxygenase SsuD/methylene tetrahydromethanopterin reductase-like flavin-dependent oxidoreductase (luciferase family)
VRFYLLVNPYCWPDKDSPIRLAGKRTDLYQTMLEVLFEHAEIADRLGFEGMFISEQHGNIEGIPEVTANPILLNLAIADRTQRIMVGQLGNTLPVANPLQVADMVAHLDQLTKGRVLTGFTRGNTPRWADQYGQHIPMRATRSDKSESDERNLRALMECWQIIKLAWTQDTFSFDGEFWKFPIPDTKWPYPPTKIWGQGVDDDDNLTEVGIAPRPYQDPYPRVFAPMSGRAATVRFWAREGATVVCLTSREDLIDGLLSIYADEAAVVGRGTVRGEGIIVGGHYAIAHDDATAAARARVNDEWDTQFYGAPPYNLPHPMGLNGTPQQIIDQIGALHDKFGVQEVLLLHQLPAPHGREVSTEMLEMLGTEVLPAFGVKALEPAEAVRV